MRKFTDKMGLRQYMIDGEIVKSLDSFGNWQIIAVIIRETRKGFYYRDILFNEHFQSWKQLIMKTE